MKLLWFLLGLIDWLWCFLMPLIGTLHLVSEKYRKHNKDKAHLFTHWCHYWILFVFCNVIIGFVSLFISRLGILLTILRIVAMSVVVNPRFSLLSDVTEKIKDNAGDLTEIKENCLNNIRILGRLIRKYKESKC